MAASGNGAGIGPGIRSNGTGAGTRHRYRDERSLRCTFDTACPAAPHAIHAEVLPGALVGSQLTQTATLAPAGPPPNGGQGAGPKLSSRLTSQRCAIQFVVL